MDRTGKERRGEARQARRGKEGTGMAGLGMAGTQPKRNWRQNVRTQQKRIPIAHLLEDMAIYPRHAVDDQHVKSLLDAIEAGATLPPIVAEKKNLRIVDGWHRYRAWRRHLGEEGSVEVEVVDYQNEAEVIKDAIERNARHGRRLDSMDKVRAVLMARGVGLTDKVIAHVMNIPESRVVKMATRVVNVTPESVRKLDRTQPIVIPVKRCMQHFQGQTITKEQADAHVSAPGTSYSLIVRQLHDALVYKLINRDDEKLRAQLVELGECLDAYLDATALT